MQVDIPSPSDVKHVLNSGAEFHWITPSNFFFFFCGQQLFILYYFLGGGCCYEADFTPLTLQAMGNFLQLPTQFHLFKGVWNVQFYRQTRSHRLFETILFWQHIMLFQIPLGLNHMSFMLSRVPLLDDLIWFYISSSSLLGPISCSY